MSNADDVHARRLAWGLDLSNPEVTTQEEIDEFRRVALRQLGVGQAGLMFWLDQDPEVLKRYRSWADTLRVNLPGTPNNFFSASGLANTVSYANYGFIQGLTYGALAMNRFLTREEILEIYSLVFRYVGPRGMAMIAEATKDFEWKEPELPAVWPDGWGPDPEAFRSGLDFSKPSLSDAEFKLIQDWYERWLGEVPGHVMLLGRYRPETLKAYRSRFENTLRLLPKQVEPSALIGVSIERVFPQGIREGVLMARGFGMTRPEVLEVMCWGSFSGTVPALDAAWDAVADVLETWDDSR